MVYLMSSINYLDCHVGDTTGRHGANPKSEATFDRVAVEFFERFSGGGPSASRPGSSLTDDGDVNMDL